MVQSIHIFTSQPIGKLNKLIEINLKYNNVHKYFITSTYACIIIISKLFKLYFESYLCETMVE